MTSTIDERVARLNLCDLSLRDISWIEDGRDVVLTFLAPPNDAELRFVCRWARGFRATIELDPDSGGFALSWDGELSRAEDGSWNVAFDFAGAGRLSLGCQELEIAEAEGGGGSIVV